MKRQAYVNGEYVNESEAKVSIYDSALMFGDMIFEMTRSFNKKQFKLREHLERLYTGINALKIPLKMSIDEMENVCNEVIKKNEPLFDEKDEHRLMIDVSRGPLSIYSEVFLDKGKAEPAEPTVIIADFPLKWTVRGMGKFFDSGINAVITSQRAVPSSLVDQRIKHRSRIHLQRANMEVSQYPGDNNWALLLDSDGFIAEGTGANFFIVKGSKLCTPTAKNILGGISRAYVFELAAQNGLKCDEKDILPEEAYGADEAFFTGTPFCMLPVTSLNGKNIGQGDVGKITRMLLDAWSRNVNVDIINQIKMFNAETDKTEKQPGPTPYTFK